MVVANATGCSSIYGGSFPATPYTTNKEGRGPAWANSLFEDNAEFGFGMLNASNALRDQIATHMEEALEECQDCGDRVHELFKLWLENREDYKVTREVANELVPLLKDKDCPHAKAIYELRDHLVKRSQWIFGGDGWAYDIGYNGVDHVLASGEDVNILVLDTEVYSNTGGQASKSTPTGAIAKFAATGKRTKKKDLALLAMDYGYVYVAQVSMGADMNQVVKAFAEAEAYHGPSIIIAYAPCINHGIKGGMDNSQMEMKKAVDCGYWQLFRYNPTLVGTDKAPLAIDSKEPTDDYQAFLMNETRYASLAKMNPDAAKVLFAKNEEDAAKKRAFYVKKAASYTEE